MEQPQKFRASSPWVLIAFCAAMAGLGGAVGSDEKQNIVDNFLNSGSEGSGMDGAVAALAGFVRWTARASSGERRIFSAGDAGGAASALLARAMP